MGRSSDSEKWSGEVTAHSDALDLKAHLFQIETESVRGQFVTAAAGTVASTPGSSFDVPAVSRGVASRVSRGAAGRSFLPHAALIQARVRPTPTTRITCRISGRLCRDRTNPAGERIRLQQERSPRDIGGNSPAPGAWS